jgi:exopolysaccharide production protein ExoQ
VIADRFWPSPSARAIVRRPALSAGAAAGESQQFLLTPAAIGFYFAFRVVSFLIAVRLFMAEASDGVVASLILNFAFPLVVVFECFGAEPQNAGLLRQLKPFRWVLFFLAFSGCSLVWSSTSSIAAAATYWCAMLADLAMVLLLMRIHPVLDVGCSLMQGFVWGACAVAFSAWMLPAQSDLRLGDEELLGPNQIGYVCALAMFFAQFLIRRKQPLWILPSVFLGVTLLRTISKTTIVALIAGQAFILLRDRSLSRKWKLAMIGGAALILVAFSGLISDYYVVYTNAGSQAETLTGRLGIWAYFLEQSLEQPWVGHGFHSVWKVVPLFSGSFEARHAHNELIQQLYAYGIVGVVMLFGIYGSLWRQIRSMPSSPLKAFAGGLLVFILVRGLADTEPFDLSLPLWAITLFSAILLTGAAPAGDSSGRPAIQASRVRSSTV